MNIKNILLIGRTGSGKSTLANVLINQNNNFEEVFKESAGSVSETKQIQVQEFTVYLTRDGSEIIRYLIIDTAGFGDTRLGNKEVLQLLESLVKIIGDEGINQIFFVTGGRFTEKEIETYKILESVLFDQEVINYTTIVRTNFPNFSDENKCEEDRQKLRNENQELFRILASSKIIYVDNPPLVGRPASVEINQGVRGESREKLIMHLMGYQAIYKPANLATLQQRINDYQTKTERLEKELKEKEETRRKREAELQQQISSLQIQQQNELNSARQNFNSQLNSTYAEQQRQINEANSRHQRELQSLRESQTREICCYFCPRNHQVIIQFVDIDAKCGDSYAACSSCNRNYDVSECEGLFRKYSLEEWARMRGEMHGEQMRQLQQQIQDQERRNQEQIASINRQINQSYSFINSQRSASENSISQRYQQRENNLRSELQKQSDEVQDIRHELNRLQSEVNQYIEQRMNPHR